MVLDVGRIKHRADLMHRSTGSNAAAIPSNWVLSADGLKNVVWTPRDVAGGGSVSYGSNANDISVAGQAGASSLVSRADHVHRGVRSVSHSSNTFYGDVTLIAGTGIGITSPAVGTLTLTGTPGPAGPPGAGGGGGSHSYIGYNTIGGTWESMTLGRVYAKKVTLASAGTVTSIGAYIQATTSDQVGSGIGLAIYDDVAGTPDEVVFQAQVTADILLMDNVSGGGGVSRPRWFHKPCGMYLAAGDWWICVYCVDTNDTIQIAFDATGSDRFYTSGNVWIADWGFYSPTTSANQYSIRADLT